MYSMLGTLSYSLILLHIYTMFQNGLLQSLLYYHHKITFCLQLESLSQKDLASRLKMNCVNCYVEPQKLNGLFITILDVFDDYALSNAVREDMYKCYPTAKLAHLKSGGNFPYLSRSDEVNLHLQVSVKKIVEHYVFQCTADLYLNREPTWLK